MTRITIEVPAEKDIWLLMALLQRLNVKVVENSSIISRQNPSDELRKFILNGLPARKDFNAFVKDFEDARMDKVLPGRE